MEFTELKMTHEIQRYGRTLLPRVAAGLSGAWKAMDASALVSVMNLHCGMRLNPIGIDATQSRFHEGFNRPGPVIADLAQHLNVKHKGI